jgi:hypothetical protein
MICLWGAYIFLLNYLNITSHSSKPQNAKIIATATLEGTRKGGRPRKRWGDEVKQNLNVKGITAGR